MKMVDRESTKLPTKTPKMAITSLLSRNFVFERKWGFDKMGTFGQNPCLFGENGYPFYQEHTVCRPRIAPLMVPLPLLHVASPGDGSGTIDYAEQWYSIERI